MRRQGPLPAGMVLTSDTPLTPEERARLQQMGISLPPASAVTETVAQKAKQSIESEEVVPKTDKVVELPEPIQVSELPPAHQAEILRSLAAYQQMNSPKAAEEAKAPANFRKLDPEPVAAPAPKSEAPSATGLPEKVYCQHCGWDQHRKDPEDPSDHDKLAFLQAFLGQQRYMKAYSLLGGRVTVVFRTLTAQEADMCHTQTAYDADALPVTDIGQFYRTLNDYRLCLGLAAVDYGTKKFQLPSLDAYETDKPEPRTTKLKAIVPYIYDQILVQEPIRSACAAAWYRFQRLAERMWAHVDDPNFWPAIEGQP